MSKSNTRLRTPQPPILILVATTTEEKVVQYNAIARAKGLPFQFRRLNEVVSAFHSAEEDKGDRKENAAQKFHEIQDIIENFKSNPAYREVLRQKCEAWGIPFVEEQIYFMTEDSTFTTEKLIWKNLRKLLIKQELVPSSLLESADKKGTEVGPGAETGPILAATGMARFFSLLEAAAKDAKYRRSEIPLTDNVTCVIARLSDPKQAPKIYLEGRTPLVLTTSKKFSIINPDFFIDISGDYLALPSKPNQPLSRRFSHFLQKHSARGKVIEQIAEHIASHALSLDWPRQNIQIAGHDIAGRKKKREESRMVVVKFSAGNLRETIGSFRVRDRHPQTNESDNPIYDALTLASKIGEADAFIFPPLNPYRLIDRLTYFYRITSCIVAKQLESADMYKPAIVMGTTAHSPAFNLCVLLANAGMNKDYISIPFYEHWQIKLPEGVNHVATGYFDFISSPFEHRLRLAASEILDHRLSRYNRFVAPDRLPTLRSDEDRSSEQKNVAVFISASNDNLRLNLDAYHYAKFLAIEGYGLVWGLGDRHAMGSVFQGYKDSGGRHVSGYSTPSIVKSESKLGYVPDCDTWELCPDIFMRMTRMIEKSDVIVVFPGGAGTVQELLAFLILKETMPEKMANKSLIIYDSDIFGKPNSLVPPFWCTILNIIVGSNFGNNLFYDHKSFASQGIYMATNSRELKQLTTKLMGKKPLSPAARRNQRLTRELAA